MAHLKHTLFINAPVDTINAIVKDPHRWPEFWVGMSEPIRVFGDGGPGTKAEFSQEMMGWRLRVIDRTVEERHNADGSTDWRWQFEGSTFGWLTCHHEPRDEGTEITTDFDYSLPGSVFGKAADRLLIEKRSRRDFEDSLENLKLLAEAAVAAPAAAAT
jgi:hypothetical protein